MVSTLVGVAVFLAFLLLAVQVMLHLYASSVVESAAFDAARTVSSADCGPPCVGRAETKLRAGLGGLGDGMELSWDVGTEQVRLTVTGRSPARLVGGLAQLTGMSGISETVEVRREIADR